MYDLKSLRRNIEREAPAGVFFQEDRLECAQAVIGHGVGAFQIFDIALKNFMRRACADI